MHGIDELLASELKVPVFVADEPMNCVAKGTGIMLQDIDKLNNVKLGRAKKVQRQKLTLRCQNGSGSYCSGVFIRRQAA